MLAQKLSQVEGVGQVVVGGGARPAVRVRVDPDGWRSWGSASEQVRAALGAANANRPKGELADGTSSLERSPPTTSYSRPSSTGR